jgi:hypothetical protein
MTFPTIPTGGRVLFANQANTTATRTFPAFSGLTYNDGDLLLAVVTTYQSTTNPQFSSWSNGFTELSAGGDQGSSTTMGIGIAYKIASGSESGSLTVTQAATITGHASMCLMSIPLAHASTAPEAGTIANGTAAAANPGAFNPAGWDTEDTLWISVVTSGMTSGTGSWTGTGTTAPANYTDRGDSNKADGSTTGEVEIAVAFRQLNAASEDVGTAGVDTSNARNSALVIAVRPAPTVHATTGVLAPTGATVAGTAARTRVHPTSGALATAGAAVDGSAARSGGTVTHDTTGVLAGQGAAVDGAAARFRAHAASGVLGTAGAVVDGAAVHRALHATTGVLTGAGATVAGSAARTRAHPTSGALTGAGATVVGSAARTRVHASSGVLAGSGAVVEGDAARSGAPAVHDTTGALEGAGAAVAGSAARSGGAVTHDTSGALVGPGAAVEGSAALASSVVGGWRFKKRPYHIELDGERIYFDTQAEALEALRDLREQEKEKPKKQRRRWRLIQSPRPAAGESVPVAVQTTAITTPLVDDEDEDEYILMMIA